MFLLSVNVGIVDTVASCEALCVIDRIKAS